MQARHILTIVAAAFLAAALVRLVRDGGRLGPASRTWLLVALVFGGISAWLWRTHGGTLQ
ncbi:hypothetical protein [Variovorax sp.]|uniref:hypothetical protein n=1 Tax=Variovorax sp. TaxID=1871043 RepID=UPI002D69DC10|nr:hypothetical protein [Variovorax sp.]HYP84234.1 hypothetical protein [Variovorax sp.]